MHFFIREMKPGDADEVARLSNQLGYAISREHTAKNIEAINKATGEAIWLVLHEGMAAGWIHVFSTTRVESGTFGEIGGLVIDGQYRRKGAGRLLVEKAKQWCISKGIPAPRVRCNTKRKEAHVFYSSLQFRESKEQKIFEIRLP